MPDLVVAVKHRDVWITHTAAGYHVVLRHPDDEPGEPVDPIVHATFADFPKAEAMAALIAKQFEDDDDVLEAQRELCGYLRSGHELH